MQCYHLSLCFWTSVHLCCHMWMNSWWEEQFPGLQQEIRHLLKGHVYRIYDVGYQWQYDLSLAQEETITSLDGRYNALWYTFKVFLQELISFNFGKISIHKKWMTLPIIIDSYDLASIFRKRIQDLEDCLFLAQTSPYLEINVYMQTYSKPLRNNLSVFQRKKKDGNESGIMSSY